MKKLLILMLLSCLSGQAMAQKSYEVTSPNGEIQMTIRISDKIYYDISCQRQPLLQQGVLQLTLGKEVLGLHPKVAGRSMEHVDETLTPVVPFKFSSIPNHYNRLMLKFSGNYSVEFRAFDDGVAYRFITDRKGEVEVTDELFQVALPEGYILHGQQSGRFKTSYEERYSHLNAEAWNASGDKYTLLPLLIEASDNRKVLISESALTDYPAMFLTPAGGADKLTAVFPKQPLAFGDDGDRSVKIEQEAGYIAKTSGKRAFPWRYFVITTDDRQLIENTMTARLAEQNCLEDTSWIKPGVTTWEWWNGATPYGRDVDFVAGCNTDTYKYFVDFASEFGIDYVLLDEGWAKSTREPFQANDQLDLKELIRYGNEKNVGVILWLTWLSVENNFDRLFKEYADWGVKGIKIDFMDRSDQWMVDYYERVASEAAKNKLFVDFHGSFKPAGLEYKYPNVLSYEGVRGMEQMGGCRPDNSVWFPYLRNAVGPMDYTPGAMLNYQPEKYRADRPNSGSIGTRAYQMALYVLFETGLQMMADNPTLYYQNADCARFMAEVPVMTDETIALSAKAGEYTVVAKRKGSKWYIGGMTNDAEPERIFELSLDFFETGKTYHMTSWEDGVNANTQAMHVVKRETTVAGGEILRIRMARNGGFAAVIE